MKGKQSRKGTKTRRRGNTSGTNPNSQAQIYTGPTRLPLAKRQEETTTVELVQVIQVASNSSGVVNTVLLIQLNQFNESSSVIALWDENRCLSCTFEYCPQAMFTEQPTILAQSNMVVCLDRDSNAALTTLSGGFQFESSVIGSTSEKIRPAPYMMSGSEDASFSATSSVLDGAWKMYSANLTASSVYGYAYLRALFQLRGRL
jgi:hypothetical protein